MSFPLVDGMYQARMVSTHSNAKSSTRKNIMFKRLLVPVDGSKASLAAIEKASAIAKAFQSEVALICVIDVYAYSGIGTDLAYGQAEYISAATEEAHVSVRRAQEVFEACGITTHASVVEGPTVAKSILQKAQSFEADLIVMGSHGRKGLEKLVLGSVASQVLADTHLPVLIVRE